MKTQIALSIDQMHELQTLGLDCTDASMAWKIKGETKPRLMVAINFFEEVKQNMNELGYAPAYTLEDMLIKLISFGVKYEMKEDNEPPLQSAFELLKWATEHTPDKIKKL